MIAAVQRVLKSPGSMIDMGQIVDVRIYKAKADGEPGDEPGGNVWSTWPSAQAATVPCAWPAQVHGFPRRPPWDTRPASTRVNGATPDSIGVSITYTYQFRSALGGILRFFGGGSAASACR